jgi:hypothetical protein
MICIDDLQRTVTVDLSVWKTKIMGLDGGRCPFSAGQINAATAALVASIVPESLEQPRTLPAERC